MPRLFYRNYPHLHKNSFIYDNIFKLIFFRRNFSNVFLRHSMKNVQNNNNNEKEKRKKKEKKGSKCKLVMYVEEKRRTKPGGGKKSKIRTYV